MTFSYDPTTDLGMVRLLIPDRIGAEAFFADEELAAFLAFEGGIRRAAAAALETIAADTAMVQKVIRIGTFSTNGPAVTEALLHRASLLRSQAEAADALVIGPDGQVVGDFEIAEMVLDPFGYREALGREGIYAPDEETIGVVP